MNIFGVFMKRGGCAAPTRQAVPYCLRTSAPCPATQGNAGETCSSVHWHNPGTISSWLMDHGDHTCQDYVKDRALVAGQQLWSLFSFLTGLRSRPPILPTKSKESFLFTGVGGERAGSKFIKLGWRDGSVGNSPCYAKMKTWVWIPRRHIKIK